MLYTSFRIKRTTYKQLAKLRDKLNHKSIDQTLNLLMDDDNIIDVNTILKHKTNAS